MGAGWTRWWGTFLYDKTIEEEDRRHYNEDKMFAKLTWSEERGVQLEMISEAEYDRLKEIEHERGID